MSANPQHPLLRTKPCLHHCQHFRTQNEMSSRTSPARTTATPVVAKGIVRYRRVEGFADIVRSYTCMHMSWQRFSDGA